MLRAPFESKEERPFGGVGLSLPFEEQGGVPEQ
jgi:hypothetical protein